MREGCDRAGRRRPGPVLLAGRRAAAAAAVASAAAAAAAVCLALPGCAGTGAPDGLPHAEAALADVYGCWIEVQGRGVGPAAEEGRQATINQRGEINRRDAGRKLPRGEVSGEFLAVTADTVFVLDGGTLRAVGRDRIEKARLVTFAPELGSVGGWGAAGMLSTLSHGVGLLFSLPVWIGTTIGTHHAAKGLAIARYPQEPWERLARHARFPQGPPPGLRGLGLRSRPFGRDVPAPPPLTEF